MLPAVPYMRRGRPRAAINPDVLLHWKGGKGGRPFDPDIDTVSSNEQVEFWLDCFIHDTRKTVRNVHLWGSARLICTECRNITKSGYEEDLRLAMQRHFGIKFQPEVKVLLQKFGPVDVYVKLS